MLLVWFDVLVGEFDSVDKCGGNFCVVVFDVYFGVEWYVGCNWCWCCVVLCDVLDVGDFFVVDVVLDGWFWYYYLDGLVVVFGSVVCGVGVVWCGLNCLWGGLIVGVKKFVIVGFFLCGDDV